MFSSQDRHHMAQALQYAARGLNTTDPNPRVGCVLVNQGHVVGWGWHQQAGDAHAEINALTMAGDAAQGATVYVTLEPCSHTGKTPPCCDALINAGVTSVISAMKDPNPLVSGQGHQRLQAAGIDVKTGLMSAEAEALNPGFVQRMRHKRPWVRVKLAMSLDGRTAMNDRESRWITGTEARQDVQRWRARSSAIITGADTVIDDNPQLTVRPGAWMDDDADSATLRQPLRVVLDSTLRVNPNAKVFTEGGALVATTSQNTERLEALNAAGINHLHCQANAQGRVCLSSLMTQLAEQQQCNELWAEAGPTLAGAFMEAGLVDELIVYMAPHLMGHAARPLMMLDTVLQMNQRIPLYYDDVRRIGQDLRLILRCESVV